MNGVTEYEEGKSGQEEPQEAGFATVDAIYSDGVTLIFDGQETATEKRYKCNMSAKITAGDRVRIAKDCGTYVVEYAVGAPNTRVPSSSVEYADSAGYATSAGSANTATSADSATLANAVNNQYGTGNSEIYFRGSANELYYRYGKYGSWKQVQFV